MSTSKEQFNIEEISSDRIKALSDDFFCDRAYFYLKQLNAR
ncbi:hypothetical protein [Gloeocapsopsis dulcis]|nr:hypothetical protein [Gloeocapsopsis dulcis]WNN91771.1 hypothetical protein P0S91_12180 [Gloeocapsopsis dulcis]